MFPRELRISEAYFTVIHRPQIDNRKSDHPEHTPPNSANWSTHVPTLQCYQSLLVDQARLPSMLLPWFLQNRRQRLIAKPISPEWENWLQQHVLHYRWLDEREQTGLRAAVQILVAEKFWEGCGGLAVTEEMKVAIAGHAGLMLLGIEHDFFRAVQTVLIYPTSFRIPGEQGHYEGQSHHRGPIILAWDQVAAEGTDRSSGDNLVIHEFAHQLDEMDGYVNGTPYLPDRDAADRWHAGMTSEYGRHSRDIQQGKNTFLGEYAATDDAEFFSVASERFYMQPEKLRLFHPILFELLRDFYRVDPIRWFERADVGRRTM